MAQFMIAFILGGRSLSFMHFIITQVEDKMIDAATGLQFLSHASGKA